MTIREKWAYFFKYAEETSEEDLEKIVGNDLIIKKAYDELNRFSWSEAELLEYDSVDMKLWADQGVEKAAEERGEARALEKGRKEGEKLKATEIAKNLLESDMPPIRVAEMTNLPLEEVEALEQAKAEDRS